MGSSKNNLTNFKSCAPGLLLSTPGASPGPGGGPGPGKAPGINCFIMFQAIFAKQFSNLDKNNDDAISAEEWK